MKLFRKSMAVVLACVLAAAAFSGCSKGPGSSTSDSEEYLVESDGTRTKVTSVATIEGKPVTLSEFKYNFLPQKTSYELQQGSAELWTQNPELFTALKDSALEYIRTERVLDKFAEENGMTMTEAEKDAEVEKYIAEAKEGSGGDAEFADALASMGMDEAIYRALLRSQLISMKVQDEMVKPDGKFAPTDEEAKADFEANYLRAKHILISPQSEADDAATLEARATEALNRAKAGENFDELIAEYGTDPGMTYTPEGYYFTDGDMVTEFYEGAKALADNEISNLVQSQFGYHIIQRLPLESTYFDQNKDDIKSRMGSVRVNEEIIGRISASTIEKTAEFDLISPTNCAWANPPQLPASEAPAAPEAQPSVAESSVPESSAAVPSTAESTSSAAESGASSAA